MLRKLLVLSIVLIFSVSLSSQVEAVSANCEYQEVYTFTSVCVYSWCDDGCMATDCVYLLAPDYHWMSPECSTSGVS